MQCSQTRILRAVQVVQARELRSIIRLQAIPCSRSFHSSRAVFFPAKFYKDPTYRRDLYYHPDGSDRYALSFVQKQGKLPTEGIIGWTKVGPQDEAVLTSTAFQENEKFNTFLHQVIKEHYMEDESLQSQAQYQRDGFIHIGDERNPPFAGRIPEVEDIFGSLQINDGELQPDSYQPNPSHRILSLNGVFILTDHLMKKLKERLHAM